MQRLRHSYNETRRSRVGWFGGVRGGGDLGFWNTFRVPRPTYLQQISTDATNDHQLLFAAGDATAVPSTHRVTVSAAERSDRHYYYW